MGSHAYARLGYGYDLGDNDSREGIVEGIESADWYDQDAGLIENIEKRLLRAIGFEETDWQVDGYFAREREAKARTGVHFVYYGNGNTAYGGVLLLAGPYLNVNWVEEVEIPVITDEHRERLAWAVKVLGITDPGEPKWFLATHYG